MIDIQQFDMAVQHLKMQIVSLREAVASQIDLGQQPAKTDPVVDFARHLHMASLAIAHMDRIVNAQRG